MAFARKVVLVTGGSSGIGAATAVEFAKEGAEMAIVGRNVSKLEQVATECGKVGKRPLIITADLSKSDDVNTIVTKTLDKFGKLDILVNNAGMVMPAGLLQGNLMESYDITMATNIRAVVQLTSLVSPHIIKTKGNIINISSIAGSQVLKGTASTYSMSKAALNHFTRCAALELAPFGVRVNTISPGPVRTDIIDNCRLEGSWDDAIKFSPLKRVADPVEIADLVLFLAGDKAIGITGSNYVSDCGFSIV